MNARITQRLLSGLAVAIGGVIGFMISQGLTYYNVRVTKKIAMVTLARQIDGDFINDPVFRDIRGAIEQCQPLYNGWSGKHREGKFDSDQINRFLDFFDNVDFYCEEGDLEYAIVNQMLGGYIIEAHENRELKEYEDNLRSSMKQPNAFTNFDHLAETLEQLPGRSQFSGVAWQACSGK